MKPGTEADIGPGGEAEWQRLRRQIELAEGFWLGFIFSPSPLSSGVLRRRTERLLLGQTRLLKSTLPEAPSELVSVLASLFTPESATAGCTWIEALLLDPDNGTAQPWKEAWLDLISRMNERRDALRRHMHGGLVLVAPPEMKPFMREAASDLWSIRALVVELQPVIGGLLNDTQQELSLLSSPFANVKAAEVDLLIEFSLAESDRLIAKVSNNVTNTLKFFLSRVDTLLSSGRTGEAVELAQQVRESILKSPQGGMLLLAMALQKLAQAEKAHGDTAAAEEHLEQALKVLGDRNSSYRVRLLDELAATALGRSDLNSALAAYKESLALTRQLSADIGDAPDILRSLSVRLDHVGNVQLRLGQLQSASTQYEESLALNRQRRAIMGDDPQVLHDLSIALDRVGVVQQSIGNLSAASSARDESLTLRRQLRATLGDTPSILRSLSVSLNHVSDMQRRLGRLVLASKNQEESLAICRQLRATLGDTPETLHILSTALAGAGITKEHLGEHSAANAAYQEELALRRQLRTALGDNPEVLRGLLGTLARWGDAQRVLGNLANASAAYDEALAICRQICASLGETPEAIQDLGASLNRVGGIQFFMGNFREANSAYEETLALARKYHEFTGNIPQTLSDLEVALHNVALTRDALGDTDGAEHAREEKQGLHVKP